MVLFAFIFSKWNGTVCIYIFKMEWYCLHLYFQNGMVLFEFIFSKWNGTVCIYIFKMEWYCLHLYFQNGMVLFAFIFSIQFAKIPANIEVSRNFNISSVLCLLNGPYGTGYLNMHSFLLQLLQIV